MTKRNSSSQTSEAFIRAAYDCQRDIELTYECDVEIKLTPTDRKGVYYVQVSCVPCGGPLKGQTVEAYCKEWPHANPQSLPAHLFSALMKLAHLCDGHPATELPRRAGG